MKKAWGDGLRGEERRWASRGRRRGVGRPRGFGWDGVAAGPVPPRPVVFTPPLLAPKVHVRGDADRVAPARLPARGGLRRVRDHPDRAGASVSDVLSQDMVLLPVLLLHEAEADAALPLPKDCAPTSAHRSAASACARPDRYRTRHDDTSPCSP